MSVFKWTNHPFVGILYNSDIVQHPHTKYFMYNNVIDAAENHKKDIDRTNAGLGGKKMRCELIEEL